MRTNQIIKDIKAAMMKNKIRASIEQGKAIKGHGKTILEKLGEEISLTGQPYKDCTNAEQAAGVLMGQLDRVLSPDIVNGNHTLVYKSDNLLLISIDGKFYEITDSDLKSSILKMAQKAGIPSMFSGGALAKALIKGFIAFWKEKDPSYNDKNRLLE